jgi:mono/diheme cytochrome c family protein
MKSRFLLAAVAALMALPALAQAQEAGATIWAREGCADCHGNLAAGDGDPAYPAGPSLRQTRLDRAALIDTIACGRPGTKMPTHLKGSYTEVACYGMPLGAQPAEVTGKGSMSAGDIQTLVDFLVKFVVGQSKITKDGCAVFNGGNRNAPACLQY